MGIYYDDPNNLQNPADFRVCAGILVNRNEGGAGQLIQSLENEGYLTVDVPRVKTVHGEFPLKSNVFSYMLGAMKYYPASLAYIG